MDFCGEADLYLYAKEAMLDCFNARQTHSLSRRRLSLYLKIPGTEIVQVAKSYPEIFKVLETGDPKNQETSLRA